MRKPAVVASLLFVLSPSAGVAQESRSLEFAWPAGSEAAVTVTSSTTASVPGHTTTMAG